MAQAPPRPDATCVKIGDLGFAKPIDAQRSHLVSGSRSTLVTSAPQVLTGGKYSAYSDVYSWAVSMCMAVNAALGNPAVNVTSQDDIVQAAQRLLLALDPRVSELIGECLSFDPHRRPCCTQVRDRIMEYAGRWPALGTWCGACPFATLTLAVVELDQLCVSTPL